MKRSRFAYPYVVYALVFFLAPLLLILFYSLTKKSDDVFVFTLDNFKRFFDPENPQYFWVLIRSFRLAFISTVICLLLGYPMAFILSRMPKKSRNLFSLLFILPMWMNFLLRTYSWMTLLENTGLINTLLQRLGFGPVELMYTENAVILGMVYNFLPFMILPIYNMLIRVDRSLIEAAQDLGANGRRTFIRVILPITIPGIVSGVTMVFMPAVTTFVISQLLGGNNAVLIGDLIEKQFKLTGDWGFGSAMSMIIMVLILLSMGFVSRYEQEQNEGGYLL